MNRRVSFVRDSVSVIKNYILTAVSNSVSLLRGNDEERIKLLANNIAQDVSLINETVFQDGDFVDAGSINDLLDRIYAEYAIIYRDMYAITDALGVINSVFENSIFANVVHSTTTVAKIKALEAIGKRQFAASDVYYDSLSSTVNYSSAKMKCAIDNTFGKLTLGYSESGYIAPATCNISTKVLSGGVRVIDENDASSMFSSVPNNPYFMNILSTTEPKNYDYDNGTSYASREGVFIDIIVSFPSSVPITHFSFVPFSTDRINVESIFYSTKPEAEFGSSDLRTISTTSVSQDTLGISVSFPRILARELHIVISQNHHETIATETTIDKHITTIDKIKSLVKRLSKFSEIGFTHKKIDEKAIAEIRSAIVSSTIEESETIQAGSRVYTLGFFRMNVADRSYMDQGEYSGVLCTCDGNLTKISFSQSGSPSITAAVGATDILVNAVSVAGVEIANKRAYCANMVEVNGFMTVIDGFVVKQNRSYIDGLLTQSATYPFCIETHHPISENLTLSLNGSLLSFSQGVDAIVEDNMTLSTIIFSREWCMENGVYEGVVLCGSYVPKERLSNGLTYIPNVVDIEQLIGKPTVANQLIYGIGKKHLYVKDEGRTDPSVNPVYVGYSTDIPTNMADPGFMNTAIDGSACYRVNQAKGMYYNNRVRVLYNGSSTDITIGSNNTNVANVNNTDKTIVATAQGQTTITVTNTDLNNPVTYGTVTVVISTIDGYPIITSATPSGTGITIEKFDALNYINGWWYPSMSNCIIPNDAFYTGIIGEPIHLVSGNIYRTEHPYVLGSLKIINGNTIIPITDYGEDTELSQIPYSLKNRYTVSDISLIDGAKAYYIPIDHSSLSDYYASNINRHNKTERFSATDSSAAISLSSPSYLDTTIVVSDSFALQDGIFYYRNRYNVTYEPFIVMVNGVKAKNITDYRGDPATPPAFSTKTDSSIYEYYVKDIRTLVFDSALKKANIVIYYYTFADTYRVVVNTYKSNYRLDYCTPEVTGITAIMNIQR